MKRDLLLLHGALSSEKQFDVFTKYLDDTFICHPLTFPGHGENSRPAAAFSIGSFTEFVIRYNRNHHLNLPLIFGYSMGGYVGLNLAASEPRLISGVITLATKLDWNSDTATKEAAMLQPQKMVEKIPAFTEHLKAIHGSSNWENVVIQTAALMTGLGNHHMEEPDFKRISCPVLHLVGDSDKMVDAGFSERVSNWIPRGKFRLLENTPHPFEKADLSLLSTILKEFSLPLR